MFPRAAVGLYAREAAAVYSPEVEAYWAAVFQCPPDDLWMPGVVVTPHAGQLISYRGVFLFKRRDACRVSAPPDLVEPLEEALRDVPPANVFRGGALLALLGDRVDEVIGPNWHGYVTGTEYRPAARRGCRGIVDAEPPLLAQLRDACGASEWAEGSFDKARALFGCFEGDRLVAASNLTGWRLGDDRIGILTHPDFRGRGYGAAVASAATDRALQTAAVAEWRARDTNTPSIKVALKLGFTTYGENLAIRLH